MIFLMHIDHPWLRKTMRDPRTSGGDSGPCCLMLAASFA